MLKGKKIVIGMTGSIAAYKIPFLIRLLVKEGADVQVIMTPAATEFVTPLTLSTLSRRPVIIDPFTKSTGEWNNHVELGLWADVMVFAPVTANTLSKMANGMADNFLVTAYLSARCPVFIAPAMDMDMYRHPSTQKNIEILKGYGNHFIEPQTGELASGLSGPGRLEEPEIILKEIRNILDRKLELAGKKVLITAGPTYELIDPVRYIGNCSTGRMGFALAEEAARRGAEVTLITGPTSLACSDPRIRRIDVVSAGDMHKECIKSYPDTDITIMAAAVSDYTISEPGKTKIKKSASSLTLRLSPTTDILAELGKKKKNKQLLVGFALETENGKINAVRKLKQKNLDLVVLNSLADKGAGFGGKTNKVTIFTRNQKEYQGQLKSKEEVAINILDIINQEYISKKD